MRLFHEFGCKFTKKYPILKKNLDIFGKNTAFRRKSKQIGIDCATSVEITAADDADPDDALLITAERPIYTAADDITLTITDVNLELECPLSGPAPAREAFLAPRRAIEARHAAKVADYSVISGFEHLVLADCHIVLPLGAQYSETLREMVEADGTTLVKHAVISKGGITTANRFGQADGEQVRKILFEGQLFILRAGQVYNAQGGLIK